MVVFLLLILFFYLCFVFIFVLSIPCCLLLLQQQNLGKIFGTSKMHLSPPPPSGLDGCPFKGDDFFVVVDFLFIVTPIVGVCNCSMICCTLLYVHSSIAIILMGKRELVALPNLSSWCLVMVE